MNPLKKLAGETVLYGASSIIGRFLNYLLFPLHTLVFPTGSYGIITELYVYAAFLNIIYLYGMETSFFRFATKNKASGDAIYNTAFTSVSLTSLVFSSALCLAATPLVNSMGYFGKEHFVYMFAGILAIDAILAIPFAKLRMDGKAKTFAKAKFTSIFINIGINVFFLYFCFHIDAGKIFPSLQPLVNKIYNPSFNLEYVFGANLVSNALLLPYLWKYLFKIKLKINMAWLSGMFRFGYPILFTGLALVTNEMLSRWAIKYWLPTGFYPGFSNQDILGIFGGVFKLAILMNLGIQAFRYAAEPFFFSKADEKGSPLLFARVMDWFVIFGGLIFLAVSLNLDILQFLLRNPDYRTAIHIVPILLLASLFMGINYNLSAWYKLVDFTKAGTLITFIGAFITIVANFILVPLWGYTGSALAGVLAYFLMSVTSYMWSRNINPIPYQLKNIFFYISLAILLYVISAIMPDLKFWIAKIFHLLLVLVYLAAVYLKERKFITSAIH